VATGCRSPLAPPAETSGLSPTIGAAIEREIESIRAEARTQITAQPPSEVEETLSERRAELEAIGPATEARQTPFSLGPDLTGADQREVSLTLKVAVSTAVANDLRVRVAALQPAINREDVINANAAFDFVLFANADMTKIDQPQPVSILNGVLLGTPFRASETYRFETGVSKRFRSGGELTVSTDLTRFRNNSPGFELFPDPAYTGAVRLGLVQPLLRGFGEDVNTATIRLASNAEASSVYQLTSELLALSEDIELNYWNLVFAWKLLEIRQWLVDVGDTVRESLYLRRDFDATPAEYSDAVARVEQRRADVIRARRLLRAASDNLKARMNDPELTVGSEVVLRPVDAFSNTPIDYNLRAIMQAALQNRPEIYQALLGIDDRAVAQMVADNNRLPVLNFAAEVAYFGQDDDSIDAYENTVDRDFIDYILGLAFEYPLGNRAAEANYRRARLERAQAVMAYQQTVQDVVLDVKSALRNVVTNFELIQATRSFRVAQAENLRTLEAEEPLRGLTPEFLNLKFQRQEGLAEARVQELQALVNFNQSLAALYRSMGTGLRMHQIDIDVVGSPEDRELAPP
jgi:outer membrane protein TolC